MPALSIININCRSVVNKVTHLEGMLFTHNPDIAVLTETWLDEEIFDSEFVPKNYKVFRKDRDRRGGGVCILFKSSFQILKMPDIPGVEAVFCKVYANNVRYILGAIYRPPNSTVTVLDELKEYLYRYTMPDDKLILVGDFNLPNINWTTFAVQSPHAVGDALLDIMFNFDLLQIVKSPTRVQQDSASILDLFLVRGNIKEKLSCNVVAGISDHQAVVLVIEDVLLHRKSDIRHFPNFARADNESIIDVLDLYYDSFMHNTCNVDDLWLVFKNIVCGCIQRFVPMICKKLDSPNPWITRETLQLQRKLKRLKKRVKRSCSADLKATIHEVSEKLKRCILKDKEKYYSTQLPDFIKTSPEKFWRSIAPVSRSTDMFIINGQHVSDNAEVSSAFNEHFKKVYTTDDGRLPPFTMSLPSVPDVIITEEGVLNLLLKLDVKKSPGPDDIPNAFLKQYSECVPSICVFYSLDHCKKVFYHGSGKPPELSLYIKVEKKRVLRTIGLFH